MIELGQELSRAAGAPSFASANLDGVEPSPYRQGFVMACFSRFNCAIFDLLRPVDQRLQGGEMAQYYFKHTVASPPQCDVPTTS
ncbi:protein of unknown function [Burkholderia multivorans]